MQLRFKTGLTSEDYVSQQAWRKASLKRCPLHPSGGCGFARHGTYGRTEPVGTFVPRWYCPLGQTTISLLPDCLASRLPGSLREIEEVVVTVEGFKSLEAAADSVRGHDIYLPAAIRWTRRRVNLVRATLVILIGLMPEVFIGCQDTVTSFRQALCLPFVLPALREIAADHLDALPPPVGFGPRKKRRKFRQKRIQHYMGPDPPPKTQ